MAIVPKRKTSTAPLSIWLGSRDIPPSTPLLSNEHIDNYRIFLTDSETINDAVHKSSESLLNISPRAAIKLNHLLNLCRSGANVIIFMDQPWSELYSVNELPICRHCKTTPLTGTH